MSRSIRNRHNKNGVNLKIAGYSDKKDKRIANRKFRRQESKEAHETLIQEEDMFKTTDVKDVSNNYNFSSDGRAFYMELNEGTKWRDPVPENEQYKYRNK